MTEKMSREKAEWSPEWLTIREFIHITPVNLFHKEQEEGEKQPEAEQQLTAEFRALGIEDMEEVTGLHALKGSFANLEYTLPNGRAVKFWEDNRIYIGHLLKKKNSDRFYGLVADENYLMVCEAGSDGSDAKIVVFKERR